MITIYRYIARDFPDHLRDESQKTGTADSLSFPLSEDDIRDTMQVTIQSRDAVTIQGARTGITGGAVPEGGHILSLSRMHRIVGLQMGEAPSPSVTVQPGVSLAELRAFLREETGHRWFFPPDPTETSATVGGMIACNASGAMTFHYGSTRRYVRQLRVVLADGAVVSLTRGREKSRGTSFQLTAQSGRVIEGWIPGYRMPRVKSAAGYYVHEDMDLVDLFIGSEGTLGVVSEAELSLLPSPETRFGALVFLPDTASAIRFVRSVRNQGPVAIEFFDSHALGLVASESLGVPIPEPTGAALYLEYHGDGEDFMDTKITSLAQTLEESGGNLDSGVLAVTEAEMDRLKAFRHAVPESVNRRVAERKKEAPGITKLGTDLAVPDEALADVMSLYTGSLAGLGLEYVIFGHIGNNHLHVNIIPRSIEEYRAGRELYLGWARAVVRMGGTVSAEHGIGKLKREMLLEMYGEQAIGEMKQLKHCFDPAGMLNPGNLFLP